MLRIFEIRRIFGAIVFFWTSSLLMAEENPGRAEESPAPTFDQLETRDGTLFENCTVTRVETEAIILQHKGGMARVSLFDLSSEIQEQFDFDPIAAMADYKKNLEIERKRRKEVLLQNEKVKAEAARQAAEDARYEEALQSWIPVQGNVIQVTGGDALVSLWQIEMVPTTVKSTLGFDREGPPKRRLIKFGVSPVILKHISQDVAVGDLWKGYVEPVPLNQYAPALTNPSSSKLEYRAATKR